MRTKVLIFDYLIIVKIREIINVIVIVMIAETVVIAVTAIKEDIDKEAIAVIIVIL